MAVNCWDRLAGFRQAGIRQASFVCTIGFVGTLKPGEGIIIVIIIIIIHKKKIIIKKKTLKK